MILVTVFIAGFVGYWVQTSQPLVPKLGEFYEISDIPLSELPFYDQQEKPHKLSDFKGRMIILHSFAKWCAPCLEEMPEMMAFYKEFEKKGIVLIALEREPILENKNINLYGLIPYKDKGNQLSATMGMIGGIPSTMFIDVNGKPRGIILGKVDWKSPKIHKIIESMLP
jgi:thiol-disulfide isomerase/thioredoxin